MSGEHSDRQLQPPVEALTDHEAIITPDQSEGSHRLAEVAVLSAQRDSTVGHEGDPLMPEDTPLPGSTAPEESFGPTGVVEELHAEATKAWQQVDQAGRLLLNAQMRLAAAEEARKKADAALADELSRQSIETRETTFKP